MMRCLRDMNMSKFVAEDVPLFLSLIDDLFPALKADRASFPEISAALEKVSTFGPCFVLAALQCTCKESLASGTCKSQLACCFQICAKHLRVSKCWMLSTQLSVSCSIHSA